MPGPGYGYVPEEDNTLSFYRSIPDPASVEERESLERAFEEEKSLARRRQECSHSDKVQKLANGETIFFTCPACGREWSERPVIVTAEFNQYEHYVKYR